MEEILVPIFVVGMLFIGLPWIVLHYVSKWKSSATLTTEDENLLDELHDLARRLDDRMNTIERIVIMQSEEMVRAADLPKLGSTGERPASTFRFPTFREATDAYQREFILHKLAEFDGNVSKAAEDMGVDRSHLYRRMKNLGIQGK